MTSRPQSEAEAREPVAALIEAAGKAITALMFEAEHALARQDVVAGAQIGDALNALRSAIALARATLPPQDSSELTLDDTAAAAERHPPESMSESAAASYRADHAPQDSSGDAHGHLEQARQIAADLEAPNGPRRDAILAGELDHTTSVRAALAALSRQGRVAPVEVTEEMLNAGQERLCQIRNVTNFDDDAQAEIFLAMFRAMPRGAAPVDEAAVERLEGSDALAVRRAIVAAEQSALEAYVRDYALSTEGPDYEPTDWERSLIEDALQGYLVERQSAVRTALAALTAPPPSPDGLTIPDELRQAVIAAYIAGATDVHNNWREDRDPDFTEAAYDYASHTLPDQEPSHE